VEKRLNAIFTPHTGALSRFQVTWNSFSIRPAHSGESDSDSE
jgi:hypothetical protein